MWARTTIGKVSHRLKRWVNDEGAMERKAGPIERLMSIPRYTPGEVVIEDSVLHFPDSVSFRFIYKELFENHIYRFNSIDRSPLIIDCGANIGLSVLYFKQLYPQSRIIAFEPDDEIFTYLEKNTSRYKNQDVQLVKKAVWNENGTIEFKSEGADAGRVSLSDDTTEFKGVVKVETVRLRELINEPVGFLKIDIEGSEVKVMEDIEDKLSYVQNLFVEYHSFANRPQELEKLLAILSRAGFRYYLDTPGKIRNNPFTDELVYCSFDMLVNVFATRSHK